MVDFKIKSTLSSAEMWLRRKNGKEETLSVDRPFYRDILEVHWKGQKYKIMRSGLIVRQATIYKDGTYFAAVRERLGILTRFDIYKRVKRVFSLEEHESLLKHEFEISKGDKKVGAIRPSGVFVPIISNLGKGYEGDYAGITRDEEEALVLSLLAVCV